MRAIERAKAAHENGLEAFMFFSVGALAGTVQSDIANLVSDSSLPSLSMAAVVTGVDVEYASRLTSMFLVSRFLYNFAYIFGTNNMVLFDCSGPQSCFQFFWLLWFAFLCLQTTTPTSQTSSTLLNRSQHPDLASSF